MTPVPYYEEKQTNPTWMGWTVILFGSGLLIFLLYLFADRYHAASGSWTKELTGLVGAMIGTVSAIAVAAWLLFVNHLRVRVSDEGLEYVFVPTFWKPRSIPVSSILSFEMRRLGFWEYIQAGGKHRSIRIVERRKEVCVIRSFTVADLSLPDGKHLILGTENPDGLRWALKKLKGTA